MNNRLHCKGRFLTLFVGIVALMMSTGCVNQYTKNFIPAIEADAGSANPAVLPFSGQPRLVTTGNSTGDARSLRENGYILLGRSKFRSSPVNENEALAEARKIGAEVVMVKHAYVKSVTRSVPVTQYVPGQVIQTIDQTVVQNGDKPAKIIDHTSTSVSNGEFQMSYMEESTDFYDYSATYWAKARPFAFGVHVKELDQQTKVELGTNKGVLVRVVVKGTPAYDADLLGGDVLRSLNNEEITDPDQFFALVKKYEGQKVSVAVYRSGQNLTKEVFIKTE